MDFHKDNVIKLDYNPVLDAQIDYLNAVGATDSLTLRTLDFTPADANTIFVAKTGSDSTGTGTQANPVLTIKKAESLITATKVNIVILDDGVYEEESIAFDTNCVNIAAAIGEKPTVTSKLADNINYYIETIKDSTAFSATGGTQYRRIRTSGLSNGNLLYVYNNGESVAASQRSWFIITDKDGNIVSAETSIATSNAGLPHVCALVGYFIVAWRNSSSNTLNIHVYDNSGIVVYSESSIGCNINCGGVGPFALYDDTNEVSLYSDRFVVIYYNGSSTYFVVKDVEGTTHISSTALTSSSNSGYGSIIPRPKGGFIWGFTDSSCVWGVIDQTGTSLHSASFESGAKSCNIAVNKLDDDLITFAYTTSGNNLYIVEYSLTTYAITKSAVLLLSPIAYAHSINTFGNGNIVIVTQYGTIIDVIVLDSEWTELLHETDTFTSSGMAWYNEYSERLSICWINYSSPYIPKFKIKGGFLSDWWVFSGSITLNGLTLTGEEKYVRRFLYSSAGNLISKWCTFEDIRRVDYNENDRYPLYVCEAVVTAAEILNCQVFNNNAGFKITSNSVLVQWNQFFKQLLNSAVYVIGAGSGIIVNHNDFLYNYICVELEDNNGSEVLKNNIYHTSLLYSIKAETAVSYTNSVENAVSFNATAGAQVIRSNPHYINDGYVSLALMDLILKSRELGYKFDSPALRIGDDLKNAGSVEYEISGGSLTWTTITVEKDVNGGVELYEDPVGNIETTYRDGDVDTYVDGFTEVLRLKWRVSVMSDFLKLWALYHCGKNTVRVYLDPVSDPGVYGTYKLVYEKFNKFSRMPKLTRTGIEDVSLTFKRAYNEGV